MGAILVDHSRLSPPPAAAKLSARVHDFLTAAISDGDFGPGAKLPTERALSEKLGVPRSAVRDGLSVLEARGQVVRIVGSGTYVAEVRTAPSPAPAPAPAPAAPPQMGRDASPADIMAARLVVEPRLAALVVTNATSADLEKIDQCNRAADLAEDFEAFEHWDAALHEAIAQATRNPLIIDIYGAITSARDRTEWGDLKRRTITAERRALYSVEHGVMVAALRARDVAAAEAAIAAHLLTVRRNLLGV